MQKNNTKYIVETQKHWDKHKDKLLFIELNNTTYKLKTTIPCYKNLIILIYESIN